MAIGQSKISEGGMNQHKSMAGAGSSGNFGVGKFPARDAGKHPDHTMGMAVTMEDGMRGAKPPIEGSGRRMQAAPDHGMMPKTHFRYDSNV